MQIHNRTSRYHIVIQAEEIVSACNPRVTAKADVLIRRYEQKLREHRNFIRAEGTDPQEIADWKWRN